MEYKFVENDGTIVIEEYDERTRLTQDEVKSILHEAFQTNGHTASIEDEMEEVYKVTYSEGNDAQTVYISAKPATPGGRGTALTDEHRILQLPGYFNAVADKQDAGESAITVGMYRRNQGVIICAWKVAHSNAAATNRVSKQIKIDTIAQAMRVGFAQQRRGQNEFVCAFRKEFLYFYLHNVSWLHDAPVEELPNNTEIHGDAGDQDTICGLNLRTGIASPFPRNRILFGAPGTGKSYTLNGDRKELLYGDREADEEHIDLTSYGSYERVTFHPDYSYANFVGTYKPVPCKDSDGKEAITYSYVPGPFMRTYVKALQNSRTDAPKPFLLVIEEINRANVAAVFGDVFQLLDRGDDEVSEYPIQASEDIKKYLALPENLGGDPDDYSEIRIPDNMFIWATMNSADQGVFPMDTAFKRRWDFTYLGIDDSETGIIGKKVVLGQGEYRRTVEWNSLRKAINGELLTYKVNEDKLMGPYFISKKNLPEGDEIDTATFTRIFKNKVLMYLFDDAAKQKRPSLFAGCRDENKNLYSQICSEFDIKGVFIFCSKISNHFLPEDDGE